MILYRNHAKHKIQIDMITIKENMQRSVIKSINGRMEGRKEGKKEGRKDGIFHLDTSININF